MVIDSRKRFLGEILALVTVVALILAFSLRWQRGGSPSIDEQRIMMGTLVSITVLSTDEDAAARAIDAAFEEIGRVEALTTRYSPASEISMVNAAADGSSEIALSDETKAILERALEISRLSDGAFDVTVAPLVDLWAFDGDGVVPTREEIEAALPLVDYRRVLVDTAEGSLVMPPGTAIDLDAIAKGYAVDQAIAVLREGGVARAIVDAGGDIGLLGKATHADGWRVGIKHPRGDGILGVLSVPAGAVATSGDYQRYMMVEGTRYHHVLDPSTGYPARGVMSSTVVAETAMDADALATAVFVMGPARGMALVEALPAVEAIIITGDEDIEEILVSSGLRGRFHAAP